MSMSHPSRHADALLLLLLPLSALAINAVTLQAVNMKSGPGRAFALVTWLPARAPVGDGLHQRLSSDMSVTLPTSVLVLIVYVLGMFMGGVFALLCTWTSKATAR
ncbi:hypothetical protein QTH90_27365 [Variovorax sp. J2P1-59]|uniref:hypothetical protein n=1 Tax=Variovorax flavidus TaxID=3053501 RepID=UPI0025779608|nr:hypothetical protein [Variovorax sp. J2P1-59]MDM0078157.1 hypothetical protein [Variovorax sp. J2P1-59]